MYSRASDISKVHMYGLIFPCLVDRVCGPAAKNCERENQTNRAEEQGMGQK